jgi:integrase
MALYRLQTREARKKLEPRDQPYYVELRRGLALGYRKGRDGGSWLLREHRGAALYSKRRLGAADDSTPSDGATVLSWDEAQHKALGADRPTITRPAKWTVAQAAEAYFDTRQGKVEHDRITYTAFIEEKLGQKAIAELTTGDFERWLAQQVPKTEDKEKLRSGQATANRRWTLLRAILNSAYRKDATRVPSADAWRRLRPFQNVDRPRERTISAAEAKRLLNALPADLRALARGSLYTGARLGELIALTAADFDGAQISIRHSKSGKARQIPLSAEGVNAFTEATAGLLGDAPVFPPADGLQWQRMQISRGMRVACGVAKISPPATFHDLRRSYGSLMLNSGAPADVIRGLLGHADMRMTLRAYAHLLNRTKQRAVKKHLPSFGFESNNVVPLQRRTRKK